jgi:TolB protein
MRLISKFIIVSIILLIFSQSALGSEMPHVTGLSQLTSDEFHEYDASWSPDHSQIVYIKDGNYKDEIWVMDSNGENQKEVYENYILSHPDWGQNGILFVSWDLQPRDRHPNLWVIDNDLTNPHRLTMNKSDMKYPSWNNDGSKILTLWRNNYQYEIYTMDSDGSNLNRMTFLKSDIESPAWSPDNSRIAFYYEGDLWVMNADATNLMNLTDDDYILTNPTWSPDGEWIIFVSDENGYKDIWIMRSNGSEKTILIDKPKDQIDPDWSQDGTKLLFTSYENNDGDIWVAELDFSIVEEEVVTPTPTTNRPILEDPEAKENIPRLIILFVVILFLVIIFVVRRTFKRPKRR